MKTYQTTYKFATKKGVEKKGVYRTKTLTDYHKRLHGMCSYATTIETDDSVDWPFGLYAEVIAVTDDKNPKRNKPFPIIQNQNSES